VVVARAVCAGEGEGRPDGCCVCCYGRGPGAGEHELGEEGCGLLLAVAVERHADFLLEAVSYIPDGFVVGVAVQTHDGRVEVEAHVGAEGVDYGFGVLVPG